jgi:hypothetical protein
VETVQHIYDHRPLTNELVAALTLDVVLEDDKNPHLGVEDLEDDISEIGYPLESLSVHRSAAAQEFVQAAVSNSFKSVGRARWRKYRAAFMMTSPLALTRYR